MSRIRVGFNGEYDIYEDGESTIADVEDNGDGTKTWTIGRIFMKTGETEIKLAAKGPKDWTEYATYATVTVEK